MVKTYDFYGLFIFFRTISSDLGKEYQGNVAYYRKKNIKWFFLRGPHKAAKAEAYVKTFKNLLYKMIRFSKGKPWTGFYQDVVDQINERPLRRLGNKSPKDINSPFEDVKSRDILKNISTSAESQNIKEDLLEEGSLVLVDLSKDEDLRSYDLQRGEIKKVKKVDQNSVPYTYVLEDLDEKNTLPRKYYRKELRKVSKLRNLPQEIEKIHKARRKNRRKEFLVSFYDSDQSRWIPERQLYNFK